MNTSDPTVPAIPNGSGAAAMLAAGVGCFVLAILACAGDKSVAIKTSLNFYKPTGPLSGVTTARAAAKCDFHAGSEVRGATDDWVVGLKIESPPH